MEMELNHMIIFYFILRISRIVVLVLYLEVTSQSRGSCATSRSSGCNCLHSISTTSSHSHLPLKSTSSQLLYLLYFTKLSIRHLKMAQRNPVTTTGSLSTTGSSNAPVSTNSAYGTGTGTVDTRSTGQKIKDAISGDHSSGIPVPPILYLYSSTSSHCITFMARN